MRLEVWKHDPERDVLVDAVDVTPTQHWLAAVEEWTRAQSRTILARVDVWCMRRGVLMVFHCTTSAFADQARQLLAEPEIYGQMFRAPTPEESRAALEDPARVDLYLDDLQFKTIP
jgi:hypothetical protein